MIVIRVVLSLVYFILLLACLFSAGYLVWSNKRKPRDEGYSRLEKIELWSAAAFCALSLVLSILSIIVEITRAK